MRPFEPQPTVCTRCGQREATHLAPESTRLVCEQCHDELWDERDGAVYAEPDDREADELCDRCAGSSYDLSAMSQTAPCPDGYGHPDEKTP